VPHFRFVALDGVSLAIRPPALAVGEEQVAVKTLALFSCLGLAAAGCEPVKIVPPAGAGGEEGGRAPERPPVPAQPPTFVLPPAAASSPVDAALPCVGLQCQQQACPGGASTSLSGTTYAPNGRLPLYNVAVYVPNAPLTPFSQGVSCERCGTLASGKPIASALSDQEGKFTIKNVPVGKDIPLVFQVGKWRRKVTIAEVKACVNTPLDDPELTRLPRNRREGDLPRVAITSGRCDQLGCMIPKLGVDPSEMGVAGQDRSFVYYQGAGDPLGPPGMQDAATELWRKPDELQKYDMILNSCLCSEQQAYKGAAGFDAVTRWVNRGGRMFGSHYSYDWLKFSPETSWNAAFQPRGRFLPRVIGPVKIDVSFPKGKALADWMKFLDPALSYGEVPAPVVYNNLSGMSSQVWATSPTLPVPGVPNPPPEVLARRPRFITMNLPAEQPPERQCGKLIHLDVHVTAEDMARPDPGSFPLSCGSTLNKAEHVLAFFIFDLAACIQEDSRPPAPPPID
jgi:hypothetical protein